MRRTPSDYQLCLQVRAGDDWAYGELLRRHGDIMHRQANQFFLPGAEHEDVVQHGRVGILTAARTYRPDRNDNFRAFLAMTVRAEIITALKAATRHKHEPLTSAIAFDTPITGELTIGDTLRDSSPGPCAITIIREEFHQQVREITALPSLERRAVARKLAGLGCTVKQMDNALQRARKKLAAAA